MSPPTAALDVETLKMCERHNAKHKSLQKSEDGLYLFVPQVRNICPFKDLCPESTCALLELVSERAALGISDFFDENTR